MKKLTIGGLIVLSLALSACHSTTESEIPTSDSLTIIDQLDSVTPLKDSVKVIDTTSIIDTLKK